MNPSPVTVKIQRLHPDAVVPAYQSAGAACFDLHVVGLKNGKPVCLSRGEFITLRTGIAVEVPEGHVMMIYSRSGHGFKHAVTLANGTGVIDSDYRGEILVRLTRAAISPEEGPCWGDKGDLLIQDGDRIAQAMIIPLPAVNFDVVDALGETARGTQGFGSTGS